MAFFQTKNPFCLRFLPHRENLSAALFGFCAWSYMLIFTYRYVRVINPPAHFRSILYSLAWMMVYLAVFNIVFLTDYKIRDLLFIAIVCGILYFSYKHHATPNPFSSFILAFSGKHFDRKLFYKISAFVLLFVLLSVVWNFYHGFLRSNNFYRGSRIRLDFGFTHPNGMASFFMAFCFYWMIFRYEKIGWFDYLLFLAAAIFFWFGPNSRASTVIMLMMVVMIPILKKWPSLIEQKLIQLGLLLIYPFCGVLTYVASILYNPDNKFFVMINKLFSGRLAFASRFLDTMSIPLWGQKLETVSSAKHKKTGLPSMILDTNYVRFLLQTGLIPTIAIFGTIIMMTASLIRKRDNALLLSLFLFALYACMENRLGLVVINCPLWSLPVIFELWDEKQ